LAVVGDSWLDWVEEIVGAVGVVLVIVGVLPSWTLVLIGLVLFRPLSRLVMLVARAMLDARV